MNQRSNHPAAGQLTVTLRALTRADLTLIAPWFDDPETSRFLGGRDWPGKALDHAEHCIGETFRGAIQLAAHHYLAQLDGTPVGYIDCGVFDRCTVYGGQGPDGPIILDTIDAVTGAIAFVTAPARRRQAVASRMIGALTRHPDLTAVELFEAGVEPDNHPSRRALEAAGFRLASEVPDCEEMLYYRSSASPSCSDSSSPA